MELIVVVNYVFVVVLNLLKFTGVQFNARYKVIWQISDGNCANLQHIICNQLTRLQNLNISLHYTHTHFKKKLTFKHTSTSR